MTLGLPKKTPLLDEVYYGDTVSTFRALNFSSSDYSSTEGSTIYYLTLNNDSFTGSTLADSTIGSKNNS